MIDRDGSRMLEILLVEDNLGDIRLTEEALGGGTTDHRLSVCRNGEEALAFLRSDGDDAGSPRPDLILLDLNLPRKDGRDLLCEIKGDEKLRTIPVVVLTTSGSEEDIYRSYDLHANCYIHKPVDLPSFLRVIRLIEEFWFSIAALPPRRNGA